MAINFRHSPFESLEPKLRASIEASLVRHSYRRGEKILQQRATFAGIIWMRSGVGMVDRRRPDGTLEFSSPLHWGIWGTEALMTGTYLGSLIAATHCVVSVLPASEARRFNEDAAFAKLVASWLSDDFALSVGTASALNASRTEERVMDYLSYMFRQAARQDSTPDNGRQTSVAWPFSVGQLAQFVSASRPHLSSILGRLESEGKIKLSDRRLSVPAVAEELRQEATTAAASATR